VRVIVVVLGRFIGGGIIGGGIIVGGFIGDGFIFIRGGAHV
jgi:hypothetical protein